MLLDNGADTDARSVEGLNPQDTIPGNLEGSEVEEIKRLCSQSQQVAGRKRIPKIPTARPVCQKNKVRTCEDFKVYVRYYWRGHGVSQAKSISIHQLVYKGEGALQNIEEDFKAQIASLDSTKGANEQVDEKDVWRWVHFPANNASGHGLDDILQY